MIHDSRIKKWQRAAALLLVASLFVVAPTTTFATTYQVVDTTNCTHSALGYTYASCNADESCVVNTTGSGQSYMCVKTATVQGGMPTANSNSFTTPDCNNQCPSSTTCVENKLAIPTTYYCQPNTNAQTQIGSHTSCTGKGCDIQYVPLEPLPSGLPGQTAVNYSDIGAYLNYLFPILVMVGAIIAVATFTVYGFVYMTSSVAGDKSKARSRMLKSIGGLILLLSSVLILRTINPALVNFNLSSLGQIKNYQSSNNGQSILIQTPDQTGQTGATPNYANTPLQDAAGTGQQP